jgi:hypothetical protein
LINLERTNQSNTATWVTVSSWLSPGDSVTKRILTSREGDFLRDSLAQLSKMELRGVSKTELRDELTCKVIQLVSDKDFESIFPPSSPSPSESPLHHVLHQLVHFSKVFLHYGINCSLHVKSHLPLAFVNKALLERRHVH